jgi:hypothetical protein
MSTEVEVEAVEPDEGKEIKRIMQLQFFEDITSEDLTKTLWLLKQYVKWIDVIRNYEFAMKEMERGMSQYDLLAAEGNVAKRISGHEITADVTANAVVLKDERHVYYKYYLAITNIIKFAINNIRDPHEGLIAKLLYLEGTKYGKAQLYLEKGYRKDVYPIQATTFAERRRKAIKNIASSLSLNRTLDLVMIDYGRGRNKDGEVRLRLPNGE